MKTCSVEGCERPVHGRGYCDTHWYHWRRYGNPLVRANAPSGSGYRRPDGYIEIGVNGQSWLQHRYIWTIANGPIPPKYQVHHRNGVRDDNRLENLELIHISRHATLHGTTRVHLPHTPETRAKLSAIAKARKGKRVTYCSVDGCGEPCRGHGYCNRHYLRWRKFGSPHVYHEVQRSPVTGRLLPTVGRTNPP